MTSAADLERFLHEKIPLTVAMGVHVEECDDTRLVLTAPLEPNHNHLGTAFGGSLHAMTTLAGYSLLWWILREPQAHIVIRESTVRYDKAVESTLRATCLAPATGELSRFRETLKKKGKARISLTSTIGDTTQPAVHFHGVFVVFK